MKGFVLIISRNGHWERKRSTQLYPNKRGGATAKNDESWKFLLQTYNGIPNQDNLDPTCPTATSNHFVGKIIGLTYCQNGNKLITSY